jgi:hypothetical protein
MWFEPRYWESISDNLLFDLRVAVKDIYIGSVTPVLISSNGERNVGVANGSRFTVILATRPKSQWLILNDLELLRSTRNLKLLFQA